MGQKARRRDAQDQPGGAKDAELEGREAPFSGWRPKGLERREEQGPEYMAIPAFDSRPKAAI